MVMVDMLVNVSLGALCMLMTCYTCITLYQVSAEDDTCSMYGITHNIIFNTSNMFSVASDCTSNHNMSSLCMDNQPIPND